MSNRNDSVRKGKRVRLEKLGGGRKKSKCKSEERKKKTDSKKDSSLLSDRIQTIEPQDM